MLSLLLRTWLLYTTARSQFNLYDTEQSANIDRLQFDCLHYYRVVDEFTIDTSEYCLRPTDNNNASIVDFLNTRDRNLTFDELYRLNVTAQQIISWSASIDLAERYQHYLDQPNNSSASSELFFNCTESWFGSRCQYSFGLGETITFIDVVEKTLRAKWNYNAPYTVTNPTCYIHLKCDRGGSPMCLDWREVCDGRVDCFDGGADEAQCFDFEANECADNEFRCHNGVCIPQDVLKDGTAECLDQSDISYLPTCPYDSYYWHVFTCEEYLCRPGEKQFSCGGGQCVEDFGTCFSGRHLLVVESMRTQGNLSYGCWMAMACLTKIIDQVNGTLCKKYATPPDVTADLQSCESLTQFPTIPVLFGHVRFLYRPKDVRNLNIEVILAPDYVCYDEQLCAFLIPTFRNGSYTCRRGNETGFDSSAEPSSWISIINLIKPYFRGCLTTHGKKFRIKPRLTAVFIG